MRVALITETYASDDGGSRLRRRLREARDEGTRLAVLPELPMHEWSPAARTPRDDDAEPPGGPRERAQAAAARDAGIYLLGGAIRRDPRSDVRHNVALLFDPSGDPVDCYSKTHLPDEEGFWEAHHYRAGGGLPRVTDVGGFGLGVQICSDVNRPALSLALAASGAEVIVVPRATPKTSYERWKLVLRSIAVTGCVFVLSTNRPAGESGVDVGGPTIAVAPDGEVLFESERALGCVTIDRAALECARRDYPGYLDVRADLYARAWRRVAGRIKNRPL